GARPDGAARATGGTPAETHPVKGRGPRIQPMLRAGTRLLAVPHRPARTGRDRLRVRLPCAATRLIGACRRLLTLFDTTESMPFAARSGDRATTTGPHLAKQVNSSIRTGFGPLLRMSAWMRTAALSFRVCSTARAREIAKRGGRCSNG